MKRLITLVAPLAIATSCGPARAPVGAPATVAARLIPMVRALLQEGEKG